MATTPQCSPAPISDNSNTTINQNDDTGVDYCTCQYNSLCTVISENLSSIAEIPVRVDIRYLYECFVDTYFKKHPPGYIKDGHREFVNIQDCIMAFQQQEPTKPLDIIRETCSRFDRAISLISWILLGLPPNGKKEEITSPTKGRAIVLPVRFYCDTDTQNYSSEYTKCDDPNDKCILNVPIKLFYSQKQIPGIKTFGTILKQLNQNKIIPIAVYTNDKYKTYATNEEAINPTPIVWSFGDPIPTEHQITHNITLIGYECDGDDILLLARDHYNFVNGRENIIKFRVPKNKLNTPVPFSVGFLISNVLSITKLEIYNTTKEEILNVWNACCEVTPTPTPTPTLTPPPSPTPSIPEPTPGL